MLALSKEAASFWLLNPAESNGGRYYRYYTLALLILTYLCSAMAIKITAIYGLVLFSLIS